MRLPQKHALLQISESLDIISESLGDKEMLSEMSKCISNIVFLGVLCCCFLLLNFFLGGGGGVLCFLCSAKGSFFS